MDKNIYMLGEIPDEMIEESILHVGLTDQSRRRFIKNNMKRYDITDKIKDVLKI
jgi:hypothetical protein